MKRPSGTGHQGGREMYCLGSATRVWPWANHLVIVGTNSKWRWNSPEIFLSPETLLTQNLTFNSNL